MLNGLQITLHLNVNRLKVIIQLLRAIFSVPIMCTDCRLLSNYKLFLD